MITLMAIMFNEIDGNNNNDDYDRFCDALL